MNNYYFTYGTEGQPFYGGWTVVHAESERAACELFRSVHPDKTPGILNCAAVYTESHFKSTEMFCRGNFGARCHEIIKK